MVIALVVSIVLSALLFAMLRCMDFGRSIRAVYQNPHAAALMGVRAGRVRMEVFALDSASCGGSDTTGTGTPLQPSMGISYIVTTLLLVLVLGGSQHRPLTKL